MANGDVWKTPLALVRARLHRHVRRPRATAKALSSERVEAPDGVRKVVPGNLVIVKIDEFGTVAIAMGCCGIGAVLPVARATEQAGNRGIAIMEDRANELIYCDDKVSRARRSLRIDRTVRRRPDLDEEVRAFSEFERNLY